MVGAQHATYCGFQGHSHDKAGELTPHRLRALSGVVGCRIYHSSKVTARVLFEGCYGSPGREAASNRPLGKAASEKRASDERRWASAEL